MNTSVPKINDPYEVTDPCVESPFFKNRKGYAIKKGRGHHRQVFEEHYGSIPDGLLVCHRCDNPRCINLNHLALGTAKDNKADEIRKGRRSSRVGEGNGRAVLSEEQVREIKQALRSPYRGIGVDLARKFDVAPERISHIRRGRTWTHI